MSQSSFSFIYFAAFIFCIGCNISEQEVKMKEIEKVKALIQRMEAGGMEMALQLDTVAHFYEELLSKKVSILKNAKSNPYQYEGAFSINEPGEDSALSSIIILNPTPDRNKAEQEVVLTNVLDSVFSSFMRKNPLAVQIYSNSVMQVSRVYPSYDTKNIVDPDIDVTKFNFYYEADLEHNPGKGLVWISDAYVDPAGKGWILSLLHPVYDGSELFAVLGVDYTVSDIIENYLNSEEGEFVMVNEKGDIVAGKADAIESLSLPPLKNHVYRETVQSDNFRISDFNLFNSKSKEVREMAQVFLLQKRGRFKFKNEPRLTHAVCVPFQAIGWYLIEVFPNY
ncbi:PDC sensor domain-containing protein [Algoriphagus sp.]|uniref:PDC sensor domain-containing protein n=1 Tax=Algoriphagus sp. TaxID=1872435 RepID=UPI00391B93C8